MSSWVCCVWWLQLCLWVWRHRPAHWQMWRLELQAYLRSGYWAGYVRHPAGTNGSRLELYTGKCPSGFCESGSAPLLLPRLSNLSNLTEWLQRPAHWQMWRLELQGLLKERVLLRPHRNRWINVVDSLMYTHRTAINILAAHIYSNPVTMRFSQVSWMALYQFALFAPGVCVVFYLVFI